MARNKGDKYVVSSELKASGSMNVRAYDPRQGSQRGSMKGSGNSTLTADFEVSEISKGKVSQLQVTNVKQPTYFKMSMSGMGEPSQNEESNEPGKFDGNDYILKREADEWTGGPFRQLHGFLSHSNILPKEKVEVGHKWKWSPDDGLMHDSLGKIARDAQVDLDDLNLEVEFQFKGLREYKGENCAVIKINLSGEQDPPSPASGKFTYSGSGEIYRSLDSYQNLKVDSSIRMKVTAKIKQRGASASVGGSAYLSYRESNTVTHRAKPVPAKMNDKTEPSPEKPAGEGK